MKPRFANAFWMASCLPEWDRFQRAAENLQAIQAELLSRYLVQNAATEYGERYHFHGINLPSQYQARVPLTTYDDYIEYITRIGAGTQSVLTNEPVRMFELSSGSTAASKLIPYTDALKAEFQRGIAPWIYNLYTSIPELQGGPAYWSITPLTDGKRFTKCGIPIGFESDSEYLGLFGKWLVDSVMAVPNAVKNISDVDTFRYVTLFHLLRQPDLRLISIWNPTFLSLLMASMPMWWDSLLHDIERGIVNRSDVEMSFAPMPELARALKALDPSDTEPLWPRLRLISCWMDGASEPYARGLMEIFPQADFQAKGLLATEAFVSVPIVGVEGSVLSIRSHFFEFIDDTGNVLLAHQIQTGRTYSVVVTTGGGLYRYQLQDVVEVIGHWKQVPHIRFVGKADHISDWFGEKLEERFVANVLENQFARHKISAAFAMLAPDDMDGFRYVLYLESDDRVDDMLAEDLDIALRENFHYEYCRRLGQLQAAQVHHVTRGAETYLSARQAHGQRLGNIKASMLDKNTGWKDLFVGPLSTTLPSIEEGISSPIGEGQVEEL